MLAILADDLTGALDSATGAAVLADENGVLTVRPA